MFVQTKNFCWTNLYVFVAQKWDNSRRDLQNKILIHTIISVLLYWCWICVGNQNFEKPQIKIELLPQIFEFKLGLSKNFGKL